MCYYLCLSFSFGVLFSSGKSPFVDVARMGAAFIFNRVHSTTKNKMVGPKQQTTHFWTYLDS